MRKKEFKNIRRFSDVLGRRIGRGMIFLIKLYQRLLSPILGRHCRFTPSCSEYAVGAIKQFGPMKGSIKAVLRLLRCNPLFRGGYDPVSGRQC